jgi:hypothetical protein
LKALSLTLLMKSKTATSTFFSIEVMMTSLDCRAAVRAWSESTPMAIAFAALAASNTAATGAAGSLVDHVGATLVHALGRGLALGRVIEATEVRWLGEVLGPRP